MFFFYFVLESALLATQRTSPQEYAVRFSQKSNEIFKNSSISKSPLCDQIHVKQSLNQTIITKHTMFYRKHVKFFEKYEISTSKNITQNSRTFPNSTHDSAPHNDNILKIHSKYTSHIHSKSKIQKMNSTDHRNTYRQIYDENFTRFEDIYRYNNFIKKDQKLGSDTNAQISPLKKQVFDPKIDDFLIRIRKPKVTPDHDVKYDRIKFFTLIKNTFFDHGKRWQLHDQNLIFENYIRVTNQLAEKIKNSFFNIFLIRKLALQNNRIMTPKVKYLTTSDKIHHISTPPIFIKLPTSKIVHPL